MTREEAEAKYAVKLTPENLYPGRNCMHRNMGPPELFPCCGGMGWWSAASLYCENMDCAARAERIRTHIEGEEQSKATRERDGVTHGKAAKR